MTELRVRIPDHMVAFIKELFDHMPEVEVVSEEPSALIPQGDIAKRIHDTIMQLRTEKLLPKRFDYAWLKLAMDTLDDMPGFASAQKYLDYLRDDAGLDDLPSESSVSKMMDKARGKIFEWSFTDTSDITETNRRNNIVKRFYNLMRGAR